MQVLAIPAPDSAQPASTDSGLVERALQGDGRAFRVLFDRYAPAVRRFVRDQLHDAALTDEATQETFVRAHARLDTVRNNDRLGPWLFGIARRVSLEKLRKQKKARAHDSLDSGDDDDRGVQLADCGPSPETRLLTREADQMLAGALSALSDDRRHALLLRIDHGLGYGEIADAMGWPVQKVKNEIHRARLTLRTQLARYLGGEA